MSGENVFVILFRGVGGATQLPVKPLREKLGEAGFANVATYINSGNAVLKTNLPRDKAVAKVAEICARAFDFHKDIHALTRVEWDELIANNPFPEAVGTPKFLHAAVLEAAPDPAKIEALRAAASSGDRIVVVGTVAYLYTPGGLSASKLGVKFDKGIGVANTARNWNTVLKLAELAEKAE